MIINSAAQFNPALYQNNDMFSDSVSNLIGSGSPQSLPEFPRLYSTQEIQTVATTAGAGQLAGGVAGTIGGKALGAAIGTMICPGIGTLIGGALGGSIGGTIGGNLGGNLGAGLGKLLIG